MAMIRMIIISVHHHHHHHRHDHHLHPFVNVNDVVIIVFFTKIAFHMEMCVTKAMCLRKCSKLLRLRTDFYVKCYFGKVEYDDDDEDQGDGDGDSGDGQQLPNQCVDQM